MDEVLRLSKLLSQRGICSRRDADRLIEQGLICVDGKIISTLGTKVSPEAKVELLPKGKQLQKKHLTILLNKPVGFVSTQPEKEYRAAIELVEPKRLFGPKTHLLSHHKMLSVAGRLDIESKGLLVLTQDGVIAKQIISEESRVEKEYLVYVDQVAAPDQMRKLNFGLELDGKELKEAKIKCLGPKLLQMVLREGKKRQIRRMCLAVGLRVTGLKRVRIGNVVLGDLPEGRWRFLKTDESFI